MWVECQRFQNEVVKERSKLPDCGDNSLVTGGLGLLELEEYRCQVRGVTLQVSVVVNVPLLSHPCFLGSVVKLEDSTLSQKPLGVFRCFGFRVCRLAELIQLCFPMTDIKRNRSCTPWNRVSRERNAFVTEDECVIR